MNLSSQYSNAGSSVLDSGISGSLRTTLTVSSMSSCLDSAAGGTGTLTSGVGSLTGSSNARASGGARPKTTSSHYYHHHHHFSHSGTHNIIGINEIRQALIKMPPYAVSGKKPIQN